MLASYRFANAEKGGTSGEEVWGRSSIRAFRQLNHTILITWGHMDTLLVYQHLPDMIPAILWEGGEFKRCQMRNETNYLELEAMEVESPGGWQKGKKACMQAEDFPEGIPWWKSFMFHFWPMFQNPLGGQWVLAPEDYSWINDDVPEAHFYLGYSIEPRCLNTPTFKLREHRALILAKNDDYFSDEKNLFRHKLAGVRDRVAPLVGADGESVPFDLLSTSGEQLEPGMRRETIEEGIMTIGRQPQMQWVEILARSKVLLGIGDPLLSPSRELQTRVRRVTSPNVQRTTRFVSASRS